MALTFLTGINGVYFYYSLRAPATSFLGHSLHTHPTTDSPPLPLRVKHSQLGTLLQKKPPQQCVTRQSSICFTKHRTTLIASDTRLPNSSPIASV